MKKPIQFAGVAASLVFLYTPVGWTQDENTAEEPAPAATGTPAGQEVEVNEDNYRQFMELKDGRGQRNMLPENAFKPGSGSQKLDKLPEESQKHLRNQLREIIVQGDHWQPGDEDMQYPYVPSAAAHSDTSLQKQEAEAWGELVDAYHKREADIYANSTQGQAASASGGSPGGGSSGNSSNRGGGNPGQGAQGQDASQQAQNEQGGPADSYSPNAVDDPNATSTAGVSQNAMEFLKGKGEQLASTDQSNEDTGDQATEPASGASESGSQDQMRGQAGSEEQARNASNSSESTLPDASAEVESQRVTGASQNALEYLTGSAQQQNQPGEGNVPGTEEAPLPELPTIGEPVQGRSMQGTLSINDLVNAQGVGTATGTATVPSAAGTGNAPVDKKPDEDPDG